MTPILYFEELRFPMELLAAALIFFVPFGRKKSHFLFRAIAGYILICIPSLLYFTVFGSKEAPRFEYLLALWYGLLAISPVLYARICFEITRCDALFFSILAFSVQDLVYVTVHEYLARVQFPWLREHLPAYIAVCIIFCVILYSAIYRFFRGALLSANQKLFEDTPQNLTFYSLLFVLTISCGFFYQNIFSNYRQDVFAYSWLMEFSFCIFIIVIQYSLLRARSLSMQNELLEQSLKNSEKYYEMSKESIAIINRKCHDFKHQLKALSMASDKERQAYIEEAQQNILFYQHLVHSENQVINTILAEKGLFCEEKGISLSCSVNDVSLDFIKVTDLYAMLGNALDNAIEYVSKAEASDMRVISFSISKKINFVSIQVNNPYAGPALSTGRLPHTSKSKPPA